MEYLLKGLLPLLIILVEGVSQPIDNKEALNENLHNRVKLKKTHNSNSYKSHLIVVNPSNLTSKQDNSVKNPYIKEHLKKRVVDKNSTKLKRKTNKNSKGIKKRKRVNKRVVKSHSVKSCQDIPIDYNKPKQRVCYLVDYKYPIDEKWFIVKKPILPSLLWYRVKKGDSFIALAKRYSTTVFDIKRWNKLDKEHILKIGERLKIYPNRKTPPEVIKVEELRAKYGFYEVKSGDTILGIAKDFNVSAKEIIRLNWLRSGERILIGQILTLPLTQEKIDSVLIQKEWKIEQEERKKEKKKQKAKIVKSKKRKYKHKVAVIATAYTSHKEQTDESPFIAAWNNQLRPGMKIIAVSRDLIRKYGLTNGIKVHISGLSGIYTVRDKMNIRLKRHIDIYMGRDKKRALRWGRRRVILYW